MSRGAPKGARSTMQVHRPRMLERAVRVDPRRIIMGCATIRLVVVPTVVPTAPLLDVASSRLAGSERPRDVGPTYVARSPRCRHCGLALRAGREVRRSSVPRRYGPAVEWGCARGGRDGPASCRA